MLRCHQCTTQRRSGAGRLPALAYLGAALFCLTACSAGASVDAPLVGSDAATATDAGSATAPGTGATAPAVTASAVASGTQTSGAGPSDAAEPSGAAAPETRCRPADLSLTLTFPGPPPGRLAVLTFTNSGTQPCRLRGFPGVDLVGPDDTVFGPRYELPRSSAPVTTVELVAGGSAHAVVQFLRASGGTGHWTPTRVLVTPPDTTSQLTAPWPRELALQREDAATHQTTFVGPLLPGAS